MKGVMMNGYFKGTEIEIAQASPEYKFVLPKQNSDFKVENPNFETLAKLKPSIAVYKRAIVTKAVTYYKFARYE